MQENSRQNISFFNMLILSFNVQKLFFLALALLYFTIYVALFLYYSADFGYLSGVYETEPNVPEWVMTVLNRIPQFGLSMVVTYTTFSLHQNYIQDQNMNFSMLKNVLNNKENFNLFLKQYILSTFIMLALCFIAIPFIFMESYIIKAIAVLWMICAIIFFMAKPYISLFYKKAVGVIEIYHIIKTIFFPYLLGLLLTFIVFFIVIFISISLSNFSANILSHHNIVLLAFDFIASLMIVAMNAIIPLTVAHFSYKAIVKKNLLF